MPSTAPLKLSSSEGIGLVRLLPRLQATDRGGAAGASELWLLEIDEGDRFLVAHECDRAHLATATQSFEVVHGTHEGIACTALSKAALVQALPELLFRRGLRILLWALQRTRPEGAEESKREFEFQEVERAVPTDARGLAQHLGCVLSPDAAAASAQGVLGLVVATGGKLGLCQLSAAEQSLSFAVVVDNANWDHLDALLAQLNPLEVVIPDDCLPSVSVFLDEKELLTSRKRLWTTDSAAALKKMSPSLDQADLAAAAMILKEEQTAVLAAALLADSLEEGVMYKVRPLDLTNVMRISDATLVGLDIFGPESLFQVLNETRTPGGERLLHTWLRQPLRVAGTIEKRLDLVQFLMTGAGVRKTLHEDSLRKIPDLERISQRLRKKSASLPDLYKASQGVSEIFRIFDLLREEEEEQREDQGIVDGLEIRESFLKDISEADSELRRFVRLVDQVLEETSIHEGTFRLKPSFDKGLQSLQSDMDDVKKKIDAAHSSEARKLSMDPKMLKCERSNQHGFFFRVTLKDERSLRKHQGLVLIDSAKSGIKFRSATLERLNTEHENLMQDYLRHQIVILSEVMGMATSFADTINAVGRKISELDCWVSLATASAAAPTPYVRPTINEEGVLSLEYARHPCLERKNGKNYIPNDVHFSKKDKTFHIITGPNLGGKSTYMRSVALCVYLTQIGCFVPCSSANVCPVDSILVRLGASDMQYEGVSTFMAEMIDASRILRQATDRSLVIVDELGRGTSTFDGLSLGRTIAKELAKNIGAFTLFATHFFEMTQLASELDCVGNLFCDAIATPTKFTLLYSVKPGASKKSFGLNVASLAGFPESVVSNAEKVMMGDDGDVDSVGQMEVEFKEFEEFVDKYKRPANEADKRKIKEEARAHYAKVKKNM